MPKRVTKADLQRELEELRAALKLRDEIIQRLLTPPPAPQVVPMPCPVMPIAPPMPIPYVIPRPNTAPWLPGGYPTYPEIICHGTCADVVVPLTVDGGVAPLTFDSLEVIGSTHVGPVDRTSTVTRNDPPIYGDTTGCVRPEIVCGGPQRPHPDQRFGGSVH